MAISLALRKEGGELVRQADRQYVAISLVWDSTRFPLLFGVDANGNTIFNARQMRQILDEVAQLRTLDGLTADERASLDDLVELCQDGQRPPHRFLWFVGD